MNEIGIFIGKLRDIWRYKILGYPNLGGGNAKKETEKQTCVTHDWGLAYTRTVKSSLVGSIYVCRLCGECEEREKERVEKGPTVIQKGHGL